MQRYARCSGDHPDKLLVRHSEGELGVRCFFVINFVPVSYIRASELCPRGNRSVRPLCGNFNGIVQHEPSTASDVLLRQGRSEARALYQMKLEFGNVASEPASFQGSKPFLASSSSRSPAQ